MNEEEIKAGRKADVLMKDEIFFAIIEKMRQDQLYVFEFSKPEENAKRDMAWAMLRSIENFKSEVRKLSDNGKVAQRAVERAQKNLV
jgi:hypothetical protein